MPRIYDDKTLVRVCVRLWADDYEFIRRLSRSQDLGKNLLIRQVVHSYVAHVRDKEQQELNKLPNNQLESIEIDEKDLLKFEFDDPEPEPEPKGKVVEITL